MRRLTLKVVVVVILAAFSTALFAQQTGSIVGTVVDKTGAVIVNATVTLSNTASKDVRRTTTNAEGFFAFSGAVAGDYSLKVEAQGFKAVDNPDIHLSPGDRRNLNVSLAVGTASEHISVEVNASQVQVTDSGDLSSTLNANEIKNLALQGRDVTELLKTLPGFNNNTSYNGLQNKTGYDTTITSIQSAVGRGYANGAPERVGATDLVSDGAHILDPGCNCNANQTINADMVQEVKVSSSAYGADSITGPVVISAVSKSGSSNYHGGAYLHFRDSSMNSTDYNVGQNGLMKPNDRYWYPGGQLGGPVPLTHKKLTFFAGYEYYNQSFPEQSLTSGIAKSLVPTLSERAGHFDPTLPDNAAVCSSIDSWSASNLRCFNFNTILTANGTVSGIQNNDVSAYLAPGGQALLKEIPAPNHTPTPSAAYNFVEPVLNTNNGYMFHTRVDYSINDSTKLYVSYNQQHENYGNPIMRWWAPADAIPWAAEPSQSSISRTISGNLVKVFNSTTTNEFLAGLSYLRDPFTPGNERAADRKAQSYPYVYPAGSKIMPSIQNGWWSNSLGIPMLMDTGRISYFERKLQPSISDNFTKIFKTHTLKFGMSWMLSGDQGANVGQSDGPNGTAQYAPIWGSAGSELNPVLDFMLDLPSGFTSLPVTVSDMKGSGWGFYGQDEWKATRRLSINFGLRLAHDTPWTDATGKYGVSAWTRAWYDADLANGVTGLPGMRWHAKNPSVPLAGRTMNALFYAPRFGIALDVFGTGKTVLRGGFGSYYYRDGLGGSSGTAMAQGGTSCKITAPTFLSQIDTGQNVACASTLGGLTAGSAVDPNDHLEPRTLTYNFTVSQQTTRTSLLEISYVGSQSSNLLLPNGLANLNQIPIGAFMQPDPNPESPLYGQVLPVKTAATGTYQLNGNTFNVVQDYYPLTHYTTLTMTKHGAWANYNALQVSWSKQRGFLTYNLNYTWSKTMGVDHTPDPLNIHNDYGLISQDRTHVFNASYTIDVPRLVHRGRGCEDLAHCGPFLSGLLNGWQISGITNLQSGAPLPQSYSSNLGFAGSNTINTSSLPSGDYNKIDPNYYLGTPSYSLMPKLTCDPRTGLKSSQYVDSNCFALPADPQFNSNGVLTQLGGQGPYQWATYLRGPAYFNSDLSVSRTIKIDERQNVQIKFAGLNFFNHPLTSFDQNNANNINLNYTKGVLDTKGVPYGIPSEKFGRRVLELTLKYNF